MIAGIIQDADYFGARVEPQLDGWRSATSVPVGPAERDRLLGLGAAPCCT